MTGRHAAYIVVLDDDIGGEVAEDTLTALRHIKFVTSVEPVPADLDLTIAQTRRDREWQETLLRLIRTGPGKQDER